MKQVRMKKAHLNLMAGEVAGFAPAIADDLIKRGIAVDEAQHQAARVAAKAEADKAAKEAAKAEADRVAAEEVAKAEADKAAKGTTRK